MAQLQPCPQCHRHIHVDERACPFCESTFDSAPPPRLPVGRLARAAVFSFALAGGVASAGCGDDNGPTADAAPAQDTALATVDAGAADAAPPIPDANTAPDADITVPDANVPLPYGAPPARRRLV